MLKPAVAAARAIHVVSATWVLVLGIAIIVDVVGRTFFATPVQGTIEIVKNSVVAITFLQMPLAIFSGSMLRTEIFSDRLGPGGRRLLRSLTYLCGAALFVLIVVASWHEAGNAWRIGEYEGEGALRVPTWPVRFLLIGSAVFAALAYLSMIWLDWTGQLEEELAYPGLLSYDAEASGVMADRKGTH